MPGVFTSASTSRILGGGGSGLDEASSSAIFMALRSASDILRGRCESSEAGAAMLLRRERWWCGEGARGAFSSAAGLRGTTVYLGGIVAMGEATDKITRSANSCDLG